MRRKLPRERYSQEFKADALALYGSSGNAKGTARKIKVAETTLRDWVKNPEAAAPLELREEAKRSLLDELNKARWMYLDRLMEDEAVAKTSGYYAAMTVKILNEAHQLLSGGPTQRFSLADYLRGVGTAMIDEGEFKPLPETTGGTSDGQHPLPES